MNPWRALAAVGLAALSVCAVMVGAPEIAGGIVIAVILVVMG